MMQIEQKGFGISSVEYAALNDQQIHLGFLRFFPLYQSVSVPHTSLVTGSSLGEPTIYLYNLSVTA
jgi:hypothetical protein